jgi:branched-chain amino acid aminotransferase
MNVMVMIAGEVITPPLSDSILAGITRDSVLTLLREWNIPCRERRISIDELFEASAAGTLQEVWGTGTAAVVSPIGEIVYQGRSLTINDKVRGPLTARLYEALTSIHYGRSADPHGWLVDVPIRTACAS